MSSDAGATVKRFKDATYGGFYAVTDCSGEIVVGGDKRLEDQIDAALFFTEAGDEAEASFAIDALDRLFDPHQSAFVELTDRFWNPHGVGSVRTLRRQLDAAKAFAVYGDRFARRVYTERSNGILANVERLAGHGELSTAYSADWSTPLDLGSTLDLETSVSDLCAVMQRLGRIDRVAHLLPIVHRLAGRVAEGKWTDRRGEFSACEARAKALLAIGRWARAASDVALDKTARLRLLESIETYRDERYGGFWDRVNEQGRARVDAPIAYRRNESPFPIKRALDAALLLQAFREYGCSDAHLEQELLAAIDHFHDSRVGGHFFGIGYFWSTPEDPTVPFARQFWAAPRQPGAFRIGNLVYLPLNLKALETQIACVRVSAEPRADLRDATAARSGPTEPKLEDFALTGDFGAPHTGEIPALGVDLDRYLTWLGDARASDLSMYGLTAEISPLGFRADRAGQVFSTLHVVSDLLALGRPVPAPEDLVRIIRSCQNRDGGFSEEPGQLSDVFATYCATITLRLLNAEPRDRAACVDYVNLCQNLDGGYGNVPGMRSDIWHSNLAVLSLHALSAEPLDKNAALNFVQSCRTTEGAYANMPKLPPDTFSTYRAISTLVVLRKKPIDVVSTVKWLRALQQPNGAFFYRPGRVQSLVGTYMAVASLHLLGSRPTFVDEAIAWIRSHQKQDGGFGHSGTTSATTDESFVCIQTLLILQGALTDHWVAVIN